MSGLVRSYTLLDFEVTLKALNDKTDRKKCIELFRLLDVGSNGTVSTSELLKFWLRGKELADSDDMLFRLLYRHLR